MRLVLVLFLIGCETSVGFLSQSLSLAIELAQLILTVIQKLLVILLIIIFISSPLYCSFTSVYSALHNFIISLFVFSL